MRAEEQDKEELVSALGYREQELHGCKGEDFSDNDDCQASKELHTYLHGPQQSSIVCQV